MTERMHVESTRFYSAHHALLRIADEGIDRAEHSQPGNTNDLLVSTSLSALALEAIVNAVGSKIPGWKDFESCSPTAKIRIICLFLGITYDSQTEPWSTLRWLSKFRNAVAHPKPEQITTEIVVTFNEFYGNVDGQPKPESKLEKQITLSAAKNALSAVRLALNTMCKKLDEEASDDILLESWTTLAKPHLHDG